MFRRRLLLWLLAPLVLLLGSCTDQGPKEGHLRVVSWNIEWFPGHVPDAKPEQKQEHMAAARGVIQGLKPDILLLQEVRDWSAVEELSTVAPGIRVHVVSAFGGRPQNQAVAARLPADSAWSAQWKHTPGGPPRGYSFAALQLPKGRFLLAYSLHLKSNLGELPANIRMRQESTRQILRHAQEMLALYGQRGPTAIVVAGDLNTSLDDPKFAADGTLRAFRSAGFHWTHDGVPFAQRTTIPADERFPDNCFDHIFTLGLGKQTAHVKSFPKISDHNPVLIDLDVSTIDPNARIDVAAGEKELIDPPTPAPTVALAPVAAPAGSLSATDDPAIRAAVGQTVTIRGKVARVSATGNGAITFINFSGNDRSNFVAIVRREQLEAVQTALGGGLNTALSGKTIDVTGAVELYRETPQIAIKSPDQLSIVP